MPVDNPTSLRRTRVGGIMPVLFELIGFLLSDHLTNANAQAKGLRSSDRSD